MSRFRNIVETICNTPVVKINRPAPSDVNLYVKLQAFNPLGSVKDAGARHDRGGRTLGRVQARVARVEAICANTGIGLAMACAQKFAIRWRHNGGDIQCRARVEAIGIEEVILYFNFGNCPDA